LRQIVLFATIFFFYNLSAQPLLDFLFPNSNHLAQSNHIGADGDFFNILNIKHSDGEQQKLYSKSQRYSFKLIEKDLEFSFDTGSKKSEFFMNNIYQMDDSFTLVSQKQYISSQAIKKIDNISAGVKLCYDGNVKGGVLFSILLPDITLSLNSEIKKVNLDFDYFINSNEGMIPLSFSYFENQISIKSKNGKAAISHAHFYSDKTKSGFSSDINGNYKSLDLSYKYKIFEFSLKLLDLSLSAEFRSDDQLYAKLDSFTLSSFFAEIAVKATKNINITAGFRNINTNLGENSSFELWPFTAWDIFLIKKVRLKKFDNDLKLPYVGVNYSLASKKRRFSWHITNSLHYYFFFYDSDIVYKERKWIVYGLLAKYKTSYVDPNFDPDAILRLNIDIKTQYNKLYLGAIFSQIIPVSYDSLFSDDMFSSDDKKDISGGSYLKLYAGIEF